MDNQQLNILNENQKQVILTSRLGDGCLYKDDKMVNFYYVTNSKSEEYLDFKRELLSPLCSEQVKFLPKNGFSNTGIFTLRSKTHPEFKTIKNMSLAEVLNSLTELGIALWFYDDGSLHIKSNYYNLYTNKFSYEEHEDILVPFFKSLDLNPSIRCDKKKDGRIFYYLSFGMYDGAYKITNILNKYRINYYSYKIWSSETIQKWSKLQEELKSRNSFNYSNRQLGSIMSKLKL